MILLTQQIKNRLATSHKNKYNIMLFDNRIETLDEFDVMKIVDGNACIYSKFKPY